MGERVRKAWRVSVKDYDDSQVVFAPTQGRARMDVWRRLSEVGNARIVDITVRREPWADIKLPGRDPIADAITEDERQCLLHAYGADQGDPTKAGYRDYYYTTRTDPPLVALTERGLMKPMVGDVYGEGMTYFVLTPKGKQVALSMVPEYAK